MKQWRKVLSMQRESFRQLSAENKHDIEEYNSRILSKLLLLGILIFPLLILITPFSKTKQGVVPAYLFSALFCTTLYLLFKLSSLKKHAVLGLYLYFSIFFILACHLSLIHSPHMRATILLCVFCVMPLSFIDLPFRMSAFAIFWFLLHAVLAFILKPEFALDDLVNSFCFMILGCFLGNSMVWTRLKSFDVQRQLIIEKETDFLTGLYNRRKLFETLEQLQSTKVEKPSGVMMLDIDFFKEFNDKYGHAEGDLCLSRVGAILNECTQQYQLQCFRYGGEEFLVLAYGWNQQQLFSIAETILTKMQQADIEGKHITVSIGVSPSMGRELSDYESILNICDKAVYQAKKNGRNQVCMLTT